MKRFTTAGAALLMTTSIAAAGGLDRSGQTLQPIFNEDGEVQFSLGYIMPSLTGTDGTVDYDVGESYLQLGAAYTREISDTFSFGIIYDQPFGADIFYNGDPTAGALSGTKAALESDAFSAIGKYQLNERFSVFGGVRMQRVSGEIALNGTAYQRALALGAVADGVGVSTEILAGALQGDPDAVAAFAAATGTLPAAISATLTAIGGQVAAATASIQATGGYEVEIEDDWGVGYSVGLAYEIPDIALRAALTYHSEVDHDNATTENIAGEVPTESALDFFTPQSVNLEFQTGIAEDTLLNAGVRWTNWGDFDVTPTRLGSDLADLDDSYRWSLGVARRFSDEFAGSITMTYEKAADDGPVSPLGPNDGQLGLAIGGQYESDGMTISGGINYTMLGDADAGVGGVAAASFEDSSALAIGMQVKYEF